MDDMMHDDMMMHKRKRTSKSNRGFSGAVTGIWLELDNPLDWVVETIEEPCNSLVLGFLDVGSHHG